MSSIRLHNRNRNTLNNVSKRNTKKNVHRNTNKTPRNLPRVFTENEGYYGSNYRPYRSEQPFPYVAKSMIPVSSLRANAPVYVPRAPISHVTPSTYKLVPVKGKRTPSQKRITAKKNK